MSYGRPQKTTQERGRSPQRAANPKLLSLVCEEPEREPKEELRMLKIRFRNVLGGVMIGIVGLVVFCVSLLERSLAEALLFWGSIAVCCVIFAVGMILLLEE